MMIIGDVHGKQNAYLRLLSECRSSVQLGDMGFEYGKIQSLNHERHRFIPGNHDNYDNLPFQALGPFGYSIGYTDEEIPFFWVRGAESIDKAHRVEGVSWWRNEELTYTQLSECMDLYKEMEPELVLSHDCPWQVLDRFMTNSQQDTVNSRTNTGLGAMFQVHQPKRWFFGHHHKTQTHVVDGCEFTCLAELDWRIV